MNIKETLGMIQLNERKIEQYQTLIEEKKKEFEESVLPVKNQILSTRTDISSLYNKRFNIKFTDFLKEVAKLWGCDVKAIKVESKIADLYAVEDGKTFLQIFLRNMHQCQNLNIYIVSPSGAKSLTVSEKIKGRLNAIQSDGKPLIDHIVIDGNSEVGEYRVNFDNLNKLVMEKSLRDLVYTNAENKVVPCNETGKIILKILMDKEQEKSEKEL